MEPRHVGPCHFDGLGLETDACDLPYSLEEIDEVGAGHELDEPLEVLECAGEAGDRVDLHPCDLRSPVAEPGKLLYDARPARYA
jgi:hypothetical protein